DNTATYGGGGVYAAGATPATVNQCILWNNRDAKSGTPSALQGTQYTRDSGAPAPVVTQSIWQGAPFDVTANILNVNPLFTAPHLGDYSVLAQSRAIVKGAGAIPFVG